VEIEAGSLWEANEGIPAHHTVGLCHALRAAYSHRVVLESENGVMSSEINRLAVSIVTVWPPALIGARLTCVTLVLLRICGRCLAQ
jgi:hypothetical protein